MYLQRPQALLPCKSMAKDTNKNVVICIYGIIRRNSYLTSPQLVDELCPEYKAIHFITFQVKIPLGFVNSLFLYFFFSPSLLQMISSTD